MSSINASHLAHNLRLAPKPRLSPGFATAAVPRRLINDRPTDDGAMISEAPKNARPERDDRRRRLPQVRPHPLSNRPPIGGKGGCRKDTLARRCLLASHKELLNDIA